MLQNRRFSIFRPQWLQLHQELYLPNNLKWRTIYNTRRGIIKQDLIAIFSPKHHFKRISTFPFSFKLSQNIADKKKYDNGLGWWENCYWNYNIKSRRIHWLGWIHVDGKQIFHFEIFIKIIPMFSSTLFIETVLTSLSE